MLSTELADAVAEVQTLADEGLRRVRETAREMPVEMLAAVVADFGGVDVEMAALVPRCELEEVLAQQAALDAVLRYLGRLDAGGAS